MLFYLKILSQITAFAIAAVALFGDTAKNHRLNNLGILLFVLFIAATIFNVGALVIEEQEKKSTELQTVTAERTIYSRLLRDIEALKDAFTWRQHDLFSENTSLIDEERAASTFMEVGKDDLKNLKTLVLSPLEDSVRSMSTTYESNRNYLSFREADALRHFLETFRVMNVREVLVGFKSTEAGFAEYLVSEDLYYDRLKYLFLSLRALEDRLRAGEETNKSEFYRLRPECEQPRKSEDIMSCI